MLVHNLVVTGSLTFPTALPISGSLLVSGSVSIGTSSPYANLDLGASGSNNIILRNTGNVYNLGYIGNASGRIDIGFSNSNSSLSPLPYLSVTSSGNVGIGTTAPVTLNGADANLTIDASITQSVSWVASLTATRSLIVNNLTDGRQVQVYIRNTNATQRQIIFSGSSTTTGHTLINMATPFLNGASTTIQNIPATNGTIFPTIRNIGGTILGGL